MERPPRNAESDRLVTDRLMCFAYLQIGVFQALAGFYSFFVVLNDYGFAADTIPGNAMAFPSYPGPKRSGKQYIMGTGKNNNANDKSACPCGGDQLYKDDKNPLHKSGKSVDMIDDSPWSEIKGGKMVGGGATTQTQLAACPSKNLGITWDQNWPYGYGCPYGSIKPTLKCKFDVTEDKLPGGDAPPCYKASEALGHAQTSAFVSIVIVQWADLLICKTRSLSIYHQGMKNPILLFGMFSETCLCLILCYAPGVDLALGTRPLAWIHWCPSFPYSVCIFLYDETRKYLLRRERRLNPDSIGFVERFSYY
jgi:sodium/potassium-transporting ATPase subunit alpha